MMRKSWIGLAGAVLAFLSGTGAAEEKAVPARDLDDCILEIRELKQDINLLNLINGLHLTEAQVKSLLKEARRLERDLRPEGPRGDTPREMEEELGLLRQVRTCLEEGRKVPSRVETRYEWIRRNRMASSTAWRMRPQVAARVEASTRRVKELLTPAQREVLSAFRSCLIPPRELKNPVRVGQAGSGGRLEKLLEAIRALPAAVYGARRRDLIEQYLAVSERISGKLDPEEKGRFAARIAEVYDRARAMKEADFRLRVGALAGELEPVDRAAVLLESLVDMGVRKYGLDGRIAYYLLTPRIIPLLSGRLDRIREGGAGAVPGSGGFPERGGRR